MRWLDSITDSMDMNLSKARRQWKTGKPGMLQSLGSQRVRHDWATEKQPPPLYTYKTCSKTKLKWAKWKSETEMLTCSPHIRGDCLICSCLGNKCSRGSIFRPNSHLPEMVGTWSSTLALSLDWWVPGALGEGTDFEPWGACGQCCSPLQTAALLTEKWGLSLLMSSTCTLCWLRTQESFAQKTTGLKAERSRQTS